VFALLVPGTVASATIVLVVFATGTVALVQVDFRTKEPNYNSLEYCTCTSTISYTHVLYSANTEYLVP
jgi:hypothetical protein